MDLSVTFSAKCDQVRFVIDPESTAKLLVVNYEV